MATEKKRLRIGVLFGGRSGEHEVSLASAASVIRGLDPEKYEAVPIGISKDGRWLVGAGAQKMLPEVLKTGQRVVLPADPNAAGLVPLDHSGGDSLRVDVVFPVLHRSEEHTSELQSLAYLVCRLLLEKKKTSKTISGPHGHLYTRTRAVRQPRRAA